MAAGRPRKLATAVSSDLNLPLPKGRLKRGACALRISVIQAAVTPRYACSFLVSIAARVRQHDASIVPAGSTRSGGGVAARLSGFQELGGLDPGRPGSPSRAMYHSASVMERFTTRNRAVTNG